MRSANIAIEFRRCNLAGFNQGVACGMETNGPNRNGNYRFLPNCKVQHYYSKLEQRPLGSPCTHLNWSKLLYRKVPYFNFRQVC